MYIHEIFMNGVQMNNFFFNCLVIITRTRLGFTVDIAIKHTYYRVDNRYEKKYACIYFWQQYSN